MTKCGSAAHFSMESYLWIRRHWSCDSVWECCPLSVGWLEAMWLRSSLQYCEKVMGVVRISQSGVLFFQLFAEKLQLKMAKNWSADSSRWSGPRLMVWSGSDPRPGENAHTVASLAESFPPYPRGPIALSSLSISTLNLGKYGKIRDVGSSPGELIAPSSGTITMDPPPANATHALPHLVMAKPLDSITGVDKTFE